MPDDGLKEIASIFWREMDALWDKSSAQMMPAHQTMIIERAMRMAMEATAVELGDDYQHTRESFKRAVAARLKARLEAEKGK
jgi:hypothetical protein